jgi:Protein of unknown function (DUF3093)
MTELRNEPRYSEWVLPNWTSFLPTLAIFPTMWLTFLPISVNVGFWSGVALTALVVLLMIAKSARVEVTGSSLKVSNAQIERKFIKSVEVIDADQGFFERGSGLDTRAWIHFQGSVKTLAKVWISDPEDPTPYWLFSTRNPAELKRVLEG